MSVSSSHADLGLPIVYLVDDEDVVRDAVAWLLRSRRLLSQGHESGEAFLAATAGIGEACAHVFARERYDLILTGRRAGRLEKLAQQLKSEYNVKVITSEFDVREREEVISRLEELPEEQKAVFVWNELEDIPFSEIAEQTGEKVNTLISRKRYAVLYLRKQLLDLYNEIINH